jgi:hypothetical protein
MTRSSRGTWVVLTLGAFIACRDAPQPWPGHQQLPRLVLDLGGTEGIAVDTVRRVPAPPVTFRATLGPDLNHGGSVAAPGTGHVHRLQATANVHHGDTLALVRTQTGQAPNRTLAVLSPRAGRWWPTVNADSVVFVDQIMGFVQPPDLMLAMGVVDKAEAVFIHPGDSAFVESPAAPGIQYGARIEQVRFPHPNGTGSADITVEIRQELPADSGRRVRVTVIPTGGDDSVWAIPGTSVAHTSLGETVFSPVAPGMYRAISIDPDRRRSGSMILVSQDLGRLSRVATQGLARLVEALEDSVAARRAALDQPAGNR